MRLIVSLEKLYYLLFYDDVLLLYLLSPEMNLENTCCLSCVTLVFLFYKRLTSLQYSNRILLAVKFSHTVGLYNSYKIRNLR